MPSETAAIVYTHTDEAPALATRSLLPILQAFTSGSGLSFETKDISLAGRILAGFADRLPVDKQVPDALAELGELVTKPHANVIKLPNISASIPQLVEAITELQAQGYDIPDFPQDPKTDEEKSVRAIYAKVLGSAVNPVLREGNSDRRVAAPVKAYAQKNPHSMGDWLADSKSHVAHMSEGDFYGSEKSVIIDSDDTLRIEHVDQDGNVTVLRDGLAVIAGEIVDSARLSVRHLRAFYAEQIADAKSTGVLFSLHLKATMMKVSDPILFGHCVAVMYDRLFEEHGDVLTAAF